MSYIGRGLETGSMRQLDDISSSFDGSTTGFTMQINSVNVNQSVVGDVNQLVLSLGGVIQEPGTDFTVSGSTLTFTTAPAANTNFFCIIYGGGGGFATPGDLTVTAGKLATDIAITTTGAANFNGGITMGGTTPSLTIGDAGAEDTKIVFDGNAQDFYIGLDDSADDLIIGLGSTVGTTPIISVDENKDVAIPDGGLTITTDDNTDTLTLVSTDADASIGPNLDFYRNSSSPADNDLIGLMSFRGRNDNSQDVDYAKILTQIADASDGTEDGILDIRTILAGSEVQRVVFSATETVFNEESKDLDFRVESDSTTNLFNLQAVNGNNSAGSIGFASTNADGNFLEAINPQSGVYSMKLTNSASSGSLYCLSMVFSGQAPDDNSSYFISASDTGGGRFHVLADGDVRNADNSYGAISDERVKDQVKDSTSQWDDIKAVKVKKYKMKQDIADKGDSDSLWRLGVVAQDLETAGMNGLVKAETTYKDGDQETKNYLYTQKDKDTGAIPEGKDVGDVAIAKKANVGDIKDYKSVKYSILYMKAIKALQEAQTRIETLETKVAALEG